MAYIGNTVQNQGFAPAIDYFSGNGSTVTFTLSRNIASVAQIICAIDNVIQNPSSAYTVSGNAITFTSAPLSGTNNIWVEYTSLITTYAAISQSPSVIGDITASGGYLAVGSFGNSFIDGTIVDYTTGNGRITVGPADGFTIYNGGTSARTALMTLDSSGNMGIGTTSPGQKLNVTQGVKATTASALTTVGFNTTDSSSFGLFFRQKTDATAANRWTGLTSFDNGIGPSPLVLQDLGSNVLVGTTTNNTSGGVLQLSGGITFPATQSASTDPNTLDDYEEGGWTPNDASGAGLSLAVSSGQYIKIGKQVFVTCYVTYPSTANGNQATIGGFPFAAASGEIYAYIGGRAGYSGKGYITWQIGSSASSALAYGSSTLGSVTNANLSTQYVIISGSYLAAA